MIVYSFCSASEEHKSLWQYFQTSYRNSDLCKTVVFPVTIFWCYLFFGAVLHRFEIPSIVSTIISGVPSQMPIKSSSGLFLYCYSSQHCLHLSSEKQSRFGILSYCALVVLTEWVWYALARLLSEETRYWLHTRHPPNTITKGLHGLLDWWLISFTPCLWWRGGTYDSEDPIKANPKSSPQKTCRLAARLLQSNDLQLC